MRLLPTLLLCALVAACGKKDAPPTPTAAPPAVADATPSATVDTSEPTPEPDTAIPAAETNTADTAQAPATAAAQDWLVWSRVGDGWLTRWVSVIEDGFDVVASKKAVIVSDGSHLFRVERADREVDVMSCECIEEDDADCAAIARVTRPGLRAVDLAGGAPIEVYAADGEAMYGGDMDLGVDLAGGTGALLFVDWTEGGYFCGAHGSWEGGTRLFDLSKRGHRDALFEAVDGELPAAVRDPARDALYEPLKECDNEDLTKAGASERMSLDAVSVRVGDGGAPSVRWSFSADVMYACSADYAVHGDSTSSLLPAAEPLGLAGPLPKGLIAAFAAAPEKGTIGWARVSLEGDARAAALAAFEASTEPAWGPTRFSEKAVEAAAPAGDAAAAKEAVSEGRRLTREKRYEDAVAKFALAISLDGGHAPAYSGRGYAALLAGDLEAAAADFEKALTLDAEPRYQAQVYFNLGQVAEKRKDFAGAKAAYQKSLDLRPNEAVKKALERVSE